MLDNRIRAAAPPGTVIPKPYARGPFRVKGDGMRRRQPALIYTIPNHRYPRQPHEKGVTYAELQAAYAELCDTGHLTLDWFRRALPKSYAEGSCNFTTIGGLLTLLGEAAYQGPGTYTKR